MRRASDLLAKWVGESERHIARAFAQAQEDDAVLLIDEVDSFLQERSRARASWEVSQVNELLTQMESFGGVLIATTNLMEGIDTAALRRFDLKVRFEALRAEQAWELLCRHCTLADLPEPHRHLRAAIEHLAGRVTPGDFAAGARRSRFQKFSDAGAWVAALQGECEHKPKTSVPIGFVTTLVKRA